MPKYLCPSCGHELSLDDSNHYHCTHRGCFNFKLYDKEYVEFQPNYSIKLGKNKIFGKIKMYLNTKNKKMLFNTSKPGNSFIPYDDSYYWGPFSVSDLLDFSVAANDKTVYQKSRGCIPMIAGGMLFGAVGAVAGSLIADKKETIKTIKTFSVAFKFDSLEFPGFSIDDKEKEKDKVFNLVSTIELLTKQPDKN